MSPQSFPFSFLFTTSFYGVSFSSPTTISKKESENDISFFWLKRKVLNYEGTMKEVTAVSFRQSRRE